ncbi:MAG TPA: heme-binding protein [Kofleriaceae bacterium]
MADEPKLAAAISLPTNFKIEEIVSRTNVPGLPPVHVTVPPDLGPLAAFVGNWHGNGFNTIFRPNSKATPTPLPRPVGGDNILELNLTSETLSFSSSLGSVPNRGMVQGDIFLNGVPYLQSINDITVPDKPVGIHLEPGLWVIVPATTQPAESVSLVRMASIPHGTTVLAQGTATVINGAPHIPAVDITPFVTGSPGNKIHFPSQTAATEGTARLPQDLAPFIAAGTITQAMLTDPNSVLRDHIAGQTITSTTQISISTSPAAPLFGGGAENIAFLLGQQSPQPHPNARTVNMTATFWIETVEHKIVLPPHLVPAVPLQVKPRLAHPLQPVPTFTITPPQGITVPAGHTLTVKTKQIQYTQTVLLDFNGLTWPHVSVATLVPAGAIPVGWA